MKHLLGPDYKITFAVVAMLAMATSACDKSNDKKESPAAATATASTAAAATAATPPTGTAHAAKVGDKCNELGATEGKLACEGNKIIFCSSYSNYEWTMQSECPAGQSCIVDTATNSAGCK